MPAARIASVGSRAAAPLFLLGGAAAAKQKYNKRNATKCEETRQGEVYNWSGTYKTPKNSETIVVNDELDILASFKTGYTLKPIGSGLSPNGLPLANYMHTSFDRSMIQKQDAASASAPAPNTRMLSMEKLNKIEVMPSMGLVKCDAG